METLLIVFPVLVFSIVLHEVAHGWVAYKQGDATAKMLGRITLNPIPHIDPVGSILVPALLALTGTGLMLGWAKPVPVNPRNFRHYKRGDILVSLAGVAVNFILAFVFAILWALTEWGFRLAPGMVDAWATVAAMAQAGVYVNFALMLFNLIPIPPLDGSHVFAYLLPPPPRRPLPADRLRGDHHPPALPQLRRLALPLRTAQPAVRCGGRAEGPPRLTPAR